MPAPTGNQFWKQRSSHGRKPIFESPDDLWSAASEYFDWVDENPLYECKAFHYQGDVFKTSLPKMRAMTITGLCLFLDIGKQTWAEYCEKEGFSEVTMRIRSIIDSQKFEGAAADLLNANIIARDLGLADKKDFSSSDGSMSPTRELTPKEVHEEMERRGLTPIQFDEDDTDD